MFVRPPLLSVFIIQYYIFIVFFWIHVIKYFLKKLTCISFMESYFCVQKILQYNNVHNKRVSLLCSIFNIFTACQLLEHDINCHLNIFNKCIVHFVNIVKYLSEPDRKPVKCKGTFSTPCDYVYLRVIYSAFRFHKSPLLFKL